MLIVLLCLTGSTGAVTCKLARRVLNNKRKEQDEDELGTGQKQLGRERA